MSPFVLLQLVGPAVALHVAETLHEAFPDRFGVSENLRAARRARASTSASTPGTARRPGIDGPEVAALFTVGDSPSTAEQVRQRALDALAEEIR